MKLVKNNRKACLFAIAFFLFLVLTVFFVGYKFVFTNSSVKVEQDNKNNFSSLFIKKSHEYNKKNDNYLISPYSVEFALSMLKEGTNTESREEIENVINTNISFINNKNVKIANGVFIKDFYNEYVDSKFVSTLTSKYKSEILYDEFKTPDVINKWVNKNTDGMIPKLLDELDDDFVLSLGNAIAIDASWKNSFDCNDTTKEEFKLLNGDPLDVEMMHDTYKSDVKFLDGKDKGIKLQYNENLDFIAILPENGVDNYIKNLSASALDDIVGNFQNATDNDRVNLSLPRFSYSYDLDEFTSILKDIGIKTIFDEEKADLSGIISKEKMQFLSKDNLYVKDALHKTNISLNEKGTKAAAVTAFVTYATSSMEDLSDIKIHDIVFNKPFIYLIRESTSHEILFFGVVYKPNEWKGITCTE